MASSSSPNFLVEGLANRNEYSGGGTALIMQYKDGLVFAADLRDTTDDSVVSDKSVKLAKLNKHMVVAVTGDIMSGKTIIKHLYMKYSRPEWANVSPLEVAKESEMYMKEICDENTVLLANFNPNVKYQELYQVDRNGRTLMHDYACSGLGGKYAIENVQNMSKVDMSLDSAVKLALCAIHYASTKDPTTSAKALVFNITGEGVSKVTCLSFEEVKDRKWE